MKTASRPGRSTIFAIEAATAMAAAIGIAMLLAMGATQAQTIYRIVGADGHVTFSDKPPKAADNATALGAGGRPLSPAATVLPLELRLVAGKYPVTLYAADGCAPCATGRELLSRRGIPFAEKTVSTAEDFEALQRVSGASSLPFLTIGGQQIKGFSDSEWTQFLDAAGYPKTSLLPAGYRAPPATPLVALQKGAPVAKPEEAQTQPAPMEASQTPASPPPNPAGIQF